MATLLIFTLALSLANSVKLPNIFEKCDYATPDLDECLVKGIRAGLVYLQDKPLSSIGMMKIEPLEVKEFSVAEGTGPVAVRQNFKNVKLYGLSKAQITSADFHEEGGDFILKASAIIPEVKVKADYELDGKILMMPISGKGKATIVFTNAHVELILPFRKIQRNGITYFDITSAGKLQLPSEDHISYDFENLFDGNRELGDNINRVINDNWKEIFDDVKGGYEELFYQVLKNVASPVLKKVSVSELFDHIS